MAEPIYIADLLSGRYVSPSAQLALDGQPEPGVRPKAESGASAERLDTQRNNASPADGEHGGQTGTDRRKPTRRRHKKPTLKELLEQRKRRQTKRLGKYSMQQRIRSISDNHAVRNCGYGTVPKKNVELVIREGVDGLNRASLANVLLCGSGWSCPPCAAAVATKRAGDIAAILAKVAEAGYSASFNTFTMRHRKQHALKTVWGALSAGWRGVTSTKLWKRDKDTFGIFDVIKAVEVNWSKKNGWHCHIHVLVIYKRPVEIEHAQDAMHVMWSRWARALERKGFTCDETKGSDVRMSTVDEPEKAFQEYFTKMAHEMTGGYAKAKEGKNLTPFQIAEVATDEELPEWYRAPYLDAWREWEQGSRKKQALQVPKALREWAGLDAELEPDDPEEAVQGELELDGEGVPVATEARLELPFFTYEVLWKSAAQRCDFLNAAELRGLPGAVEWLDRHGLRWFVPGEYPAPADEPPPPEPEPDYAEQWAAAQREWMATRQTELL